jgi:hypothetical protein
MASLDRFVKKSYKKYFIRDKTVLARSLKNFGPDFEIRTQKVSEK